MENNTCTCKICHIKYFVDWLISLVQFATTFLCLQNEMKKQISRLIDVTRTKEERLKNELSKEILQRKCESWEDINSCQNCRDFSEYLINLVGEFYDKLIPH